MTAKTEISINGITVNKTASKGKKLRLTISPKTAQVYVHIPKNCSEAAVFEFIRQSTDWIKTNQAKILERIRRAEQNTVLQDGKTVRLWGAEYTLKIITGKKYSGYAVEGDCIYLKEGAAGSAKRLLILNRLYKSELEMYIHEILPFWEHKIKEKPSQIKFRDMKSKWGSCNICSKIITLNTKLAALPCECAEMVLVHEFVHFKERLHNARFKKYMSTYLPDWKARVKILNSGR